MLGSKYRGGFSLLGPMWNDGIQLSTWRRANALAHDDGMFTLWTTPDGNVCMYVCMYVCDRPKARGRDGHPFVVPWGLSGSPGREKKGPHPSAPPELVTMN